MSKQKHTSGYAVTSLVLGILFLGGLGSVLAIIFGYVAKNQMKHDKNLTGKGMANWGIALGIIELVIEFLIIMSYWTISWISGTV